ncbi:uncharacterized protein LOC135220206 [Macrobrachium nipponense]|uniref:uncharacterized protein LOC135220206 n=1 Tax=Macrobrachium nipponense TaxID=159736 RepID=UPI0030C7E2EE
MASVASAADTQNLQDSVRSADFGRFVHNFNLLDFFSNFDYQIISWLGLAAVILVYLFGLSTRSFAPYGRSLALTAADLWENRDQHGFPSTGRGSRSMEPLIDVLDSLAVAVKKWEIPSEGSAKTQKI